MMTTVLATGIYHGWLSDVYYDATRLAWNGLLSQIESNIQWTGSRLLAEQPRWCRDRPTRGESNEPFDYDASPRFSEQVNRIKI
jgi:hypothetical protein